MKKLLLLIAFLPLVSQAQIITTIVGGGTGGMGDGGAATSAVLSPHSIAFDKFGNMYVSDEANSRIRKVSAAGIITTVAGPGTAGIIGDGGPATGAYLKNPEGIACDTAGNLYIADRNNYRVRKVTVSTGIISTVAGVGTNFFPGSGDGGQATDAQFNTPANVHVDAVGNLFIADNSAHCIRKVNSAGIISTVAGIGGSPGFSGDNGPATAAQIKDPRYFAFDNIGNIYIAEVLGRHIRKVDTAGEITTIAGTGLIPYNGDSIAALHANIRPSGIVFFNNALYLATLDQRVEKIDLSNDSSIIYTIAGTGVSGYSGDGLAATTAQLYNPTGIAIKDCGDVYIADADNSRVREIVTAPEILTPTISLSVPPAAMAGSTVTVTATVNNASGTYHIYWKKNGMQFATTTVPFVTYTKPLGVDTITAKIVPTPTPYGCYDSAVSTAGYIFTESGVSIVSTADEYTLYPSPASNSLYITGGTVIDRVAISNLLGKVVFDQEFNAPQVYVNLAALPAGHYFVKINGVAVRQLVKQ